MFPEISLAVLAMISMCFEMAYVPAHEASIHLVVINVDAGEETWAGVGDHAISAVGTGIKWYLIVGGIVSLVALVGFILFAIFAMHWFGNAANNMQKQQDDDIAKEKHDLPVPNWPNIPLNK